VELSIEKYVIGKALSSIPSNIVVLQYELKLYKKMLIFTHSNFYFVKI